MRIVYPYNEVLPTKRAHDVYIFHQCAALTRLNVDVTLLSGKGSSSNEKLFQYYHVPKEAFKIKRLPIIRKNNKFNISWNYPFFLFSQFALRKIKPDWVFLSVCKQGNYHLSHKITNTRYLYEVHELTYYPHMKAYPYKFHKEHMLLKRADLITTTTSALKKILLSSPYALKVPIEVVPLAVQKQPLPPPPKKTDPLILMYIGQLYKEQGVSNLITALTQVRGVNLKIIGGKGNEILHLEKLAADLGLNNTVECLGFVPPAALSEIAKESHAFIAPFDKSGRMPYVAHTKLYEYAQWGRPIIAPKMPTVKEHFPDGKGILLYKPEDINDLTRCIRLLKEKRFRDQLQLEIDIYANKYSWNERAKKYHALISNC